MHLYEHHAAAADAEGEHDELQLSLHPSNQKFGFEKSSGALKKAKIHPIIPTAQKPLPFQPGQCP